MPHLTDNIPAQVQMQKQEAPTAYSKCDPTRPDKQTGCPVNELCLMVDQTTQAYDCVCLKEKSFYKVDNVCREFLQPSQSCDMYLSECRADLNEECVSVNEYSKHGTCQCKIGFKRSVDMFTCEPYDLVAVLTREADTAHIRKRPPPIIFESGEFESGKVMNRAKNDSTDPVEPLWQNILKELGIKSQPKPTDEKEASPPEFSNLNTTTIEPLTATSTTSTSTTTMTTTTTTPSTTTPVTDAPDLFTDDLVANAGADIHVYYPSTMCILNGTSTRFYTSSPKKQIIKWLWTKMDSSPAFGVTNICFISIKYHNKQLERNTVIPGS